MGSGKSDLYSSKKENFIQLIICVLFTLLGLFITLIYSKDILNIKTLTSSIPLWVKISLFIGGYIISVALHEIGHFIAFIINGVKMRALYIMFLLFIKENGKWKFRFRFNATMITGGVAIPYISDIKSDEDLRYYQRAFANSIIAAPIVTIFIPIVFSLITFIVVTTSSSNTLKGFFILMTTFLVIINGFLALACLIKNELAIGDFPAYKMCRDDKEFVAMMLKQYKTIQGEYEANDAYLNIVLNEYIKEEFKEKSLNVFTLGTITNSLNMSLANGSNILENVDEYLKYFEENPNLLLNNKLSGAKILLFSIIKYLAIEKDEFERAKVLYDKISGILSKSNKDSIIEYHIKQCEHLFGISDNREFLSDRNNIKSSEEGPIWSIFDEYYKFEERINKRIFECRITA